jgi:hypothetical protein
LPEGEPAKKGLPLQSDIPGTKTYVKPVGDIRDFDKAKDESIYKVDEADDLLKDQNRPEINDDNADKHDGIGTFGKGKWDGTTKTKYPYRDDIPNTKSASAEFVVGLYQLSQAPTLHILGNSAAIRVALRMDTISEGLNPRYVERARGCAVATKRVDKKNLRWVFSVDCGNGPKAVKIKAFREGNITKFSKMDLDIKCSCPAWRWQGPEYHGVTEEYIDGKPRGTASFPIIRDPTGINRVCKHVAAVLTHTRGWTVGKK